MGEVFAARHLMTGRQVALKRITARTLAAVPHAEQRVLEEASACGALRHPGIVEILDAGWTEDGDIFLVFERLEGDSLEAALRRRRVAPRDLLRIAVRILEALSAVHDAGWVHRDVKPANVFLSREPDGYLVVKLLDFGIALRREAPLDDGPVVGTLEYMAPEQALGEPLDGRADLWSVGALLFRGLTGRAPWPARTPAERAKSLEVAEAPSPRALRAELPADLDAVVRRALEPRPGRRWATAEAFAAALLATRETALATLEPPQGVEAAPATAPERDTERFASAPSRAGARSGPRA